MSSPTHRLGLDAREEALLGLDRATRVRIIRLVLVLAQHLRGLLDKLYADDGITTQQAALLTVTRALGTPSFGEAAQELGTSHQNVKQLVSVLERKGLLRVETDPQDRRIKRLRTTPKNRRYWQQRDPDDLARIVKVMDDLSEDEATALFQMLLKVHGRVRQGVAPAGASSRRGRVSTRRSGR